MVLCARSLASLRRSLPCSRASPAPFLPAAVPGAAAQARGLTRQSQGHSSVISTATFCLPASPPLPRHHHSTNVMSVSSRRPRSASAASQFSQSALSFSSSAPVSAASAPLTATMSASPSPNFVCCVNEAVSIICLEGEETEKFLQGMITQDIKPLFEPSSASSSSSATRHPQSIYAAWLNSKGRYMYDTIITTHPDHTPEHPKLLLQYHHGYFDSASAPPPPSSPSPYQVHPSTKQFLRHIKMYKLRSKVKVTDVTPQYSMYAVVVANNDAGHVSSGSEGHEGILQDIQRLNTYSQHTGGQGEAAPHSVCFPDPRSPSLGLRILTTDSTPPVLPSSSSSSSSSPSSLAFVDAHTSVYDAFQAMLGIPRAGMGLVQGKSIMLEAGIEAMQGISFHKGCYVGQELMARTHFKGTIRKRIFPVIMTPSSSSESLDAHDSESSSIRSPLVGLLDHKIHRHHQLSSVLVSSSPSSSLTSSSSSTSSSPSPFLLLTQLAQGAHTDPVSITLHHAINTADVATGTGSSGGASGKGEEDGGSDIRLSEGKRKRAGKLLAACPVTVHISSHDHECKTGNAMGGADNARKELMVGLAQLRLDTVSASFDKTAPLVVSYNGGVGDKNDAREEEWEVLPYVPEWWPRSFVQGLPMLHGEGEEASEEEGH